MSVPKSQVRYRNGRWVIHTHGYSELWAWVQTLEGAIFEAMQLFTKGYRDKDIDGNSH